MQKKIFFPIFLSIILILGYSGFTLNSKNTSFEQALAHCCNNNLCEAEPCSSSSSAFIKDNCNTGVIINCYTCIDLLSKGEICEANFTSFCYLSDGTKYYGGPNPTKIEK